MCIEYDGIQHYKPIKYFGGYNYYKKQKMRDDIKTKFCQDKNIKLLRIKYDEDITFTLNFIFNM